MVCLDRIKLLCDVHLLNTIYSCTSFSTTTLTTCRFFLLAQPLFLLTFSSGAAVLFIPNLALYTYTLTFFHLFSSVSSSAVCFCPFIYL